MFTDLPFLLFFFFCGNPYGLAVRTPGFHRGGPGSTRDMGKHFLNAQILELLF